MDRKRWTFEVCFYGPDLHFEFLERSTTKPLTRTEFKILLDDRMRRNSLHKGVCGVRVVTNGFYKSRLAENEK
jgi:hypothetical protein